jgi:hypothetical protein
MLYKDDAGCDEKTGVNFISSIDVNEIRQKPI